MKKVIALSLLILCSFVAVAQDQLIVDPNASIRALTGSFNRIKISHAIKVIITQSDAAVIAVSASEEKYKEDIITEIAGNTLVIKSKGNNWTGRSNRHLKVYVSFKNLEEIDISGASDVVFVGAVKQHTVRVELSGASTLKAAMEVTNLLVELSGASKIILTGKTDVLKADCSGASDMEAFGLDANTASIEVSGASDIEVSVDEAIKAEASGASSIRYKGNATVNTLKTSGASSIKKKD